MNGEQEGFNPNALVRSMSEPEDVLSRIRETLKEEGREAAIGFIEAALKDYPEAWPIALEAADLHLPRGER